MTGTGTFGWVSDVLSWIEGAANWAATSVGDALFWLVDTADTGLDTLAVLAPFLLAGAMAALVLSAVRWARLLARRRSPRVKIAQFAWASDGEGEPEAIWVTSLFREELGRLSVDPLDPLPERAPGAPLVEIVEGASQGVTGKLDVGAAVGKLFRAVWPDAAYEAWGTLRPGEEGRGRISVQLVDGSRRTVISVAFPEAQWEDGARDAAMAVAGALYPRVCRRYKEPWTHWDEPVPVELVKAYDDARRFEGENRLEEAMGAYHDALAGDPLNLNLRLKIAMLQERLALYLDAWVTYQAIVGRRDRQAWTGPDRDAHVIALYRLAILLGNGRVAEQWVKSDETPKRAWSKRDAERDRLRREILDTLIRDEFLTGRLRRTKRKKRNRIDFSEASAEAMLSWVRGKQGKTEDERRNWLKGRLPTTRGIKGRGVREQEITELLEIISLHRLEELGAWIRPWSLRDGARRADWWKRRPPPRLWLQRRELSRTVLGLSRRFIRIRIVGSAAARQRQTLCPPSEALVSQHRKLLAEWPFKPDPQHGPRRFWPPGRWRDRLRADVWQLHYNAACVVAATLLPRSLLAELAANRMRMSLTPPVRDDEGELRVQAATEAEAAALPAEMTRKRIVRRAIVELEEFARRAGSARVAALADWVAIDDPDLAGLAEEREFGLWASHHLPVNLPEKRPRRSADVHRYTARVVVCGARALASTWRERAGATDVTAADIRAWWRAEVRAWTKLQDVCHQYKSWRERLDGVERLKAWLESAGRSERIDFGHEDRSDVVTATTLDQRLFARLAALIDHADPESKPTGGSDEDAAAPRVLPWAKRRAQRVQEAHEYGSDRPGHRSLHMHVEREEALRAARIWYRLAEALQAELAGDKTDREVNCALGSLRKQLVPPEGAVALPP